MDRNAVIPEAIILPIEEKVLPTIQKELNSHNADYSENLDLRSDGQHQSKFSQVAQNWDLCQKDRIKVKMAGYAPKCV